MNKFLAKVALVIPEYDEAIDYFVNTLQFTLLEDTKMSDEKRWVEISPGGGNCTIILARAANAQQTACIGNQSGGRVFLFLHTDNFWRDYHDYNNKGVKFFRLPTLEPHGMVAVFEDKYGNKWDLIQPHYKD